MIMQSLVLTTLEIQAHESLGEQDTLYLSSKLLSNFLIIGLINRGLAERGKRSILA